MTLKELVDQVFDDIWERDNGEVFVNCCFCEDNKHRLGINVETGVAHCFKCDTTSGDHSSVVNSKRRTFNKINEEVNAGSIFSLEEGEEDSTVGERTASLEKNEKDIEVYIPKEFEPLWLKLNDSVAKKARQYLLDRGVTREQIKKFAIGFCAVGYYGSRIVVPVFYRSKLMGLVSRDISGKSDMKYLNSKGTKTLYNLPAKKQRNKTALLVEGIFDVYACDRAQLKKVDVLCGLGSKLTPRQLKMLSTYNKVVIWAEPDRAGVEGTIKRAKQLLEEQVETYVVLPSQDIETDTDPGAMHPSEIQERFAEAKKYSPAIAALMRTRVAFSAPPKKKKQFKRYSDGKDIRSLRDG